MVEALAHFREQETIVLGDLNTAIEDQNLISQNIAELLMEFGLVALQNHLGSAGGYDTCNVGPDAARQIVAEQM